MAGYLPGVRQGAVGGMSQLAAALGQGGQLEQRAFDAENLNQSRIAQALATIRHLDAQTGETGAKTDFLRNRPALYQQQAALASDTDVPTIQAFLQKLTTGKAPQVPMGPEAPDGSMGVGSQQFDPAVSSRIALALQRNAPLIADGGHIGAGDWAGALDKFREHDLSNEVLRGVRTPSDVGQAQAAMAGKPLFAGDNSGGMVDVFRGTRDTSSPEAAAALKEREARATQLRAAAESSSASAQEHRARAAQINAEGGGVTKLQPGFRWTDSTKTKQEFIPGGPADPKIKREGQKTGMSPTLQKELIETDDAVQSTRTAVASLQKALQLNKQSYSGVGAGLRATVRSNVPLGDTSAADNTVLLDNIMTGQALEMLKSTFGAAPTEGERKILLDIQASSSKTPQQREEIIGRAIAAAQRRGMYSANKARSIRDGTYLTDGIAAPDAPPPTGKTVKRTGTSNGRKVIEYTDGSIEYAP